MVFGKDNEKIEKYLVGETSKIWTPDEFFYEFSDGIYNLDLMQDSFFESATDTEMMNESLALFGLLGIQHLAQKKAIDFFARKYKFAAMASAMIWMKKMNLTTRANVGGSGIKLDKDTTTNNPNAKNIKFKDFYNAILAQRKNNNSPVQVVTKGTNTYSWQIFADVNKQQSGSKLVFHIDNDADPMNKPMSELTVRVELKGKKPSTEVAVVPNKELVKKESFHNLSFLQFLIEEDVPTQETPEPTKGTAVVAKEVKGGLPVVQNPESVVSDTKSRLPLVPFVSLAMTKDGKFNFSMNYFGDCLEVFNGKSQTEDKEEQKDIKMYDAEKKTGKRKSYNKTGAIEECWEVDFYGNLILQGKASMLSKLTNVLFGGIKGGVGYTSTGGADTLGAKTMNKGKLSPMTPFKFGFVHGDFVIPPMKLKTMYNFPRLVKGNFEAQGNLIQNCAWCPTVKKTLDLTDNKLSSIWGITPSTNREIILSGNPIQQLTSKANVPNWVTNPDRYLPTSCENFDLSGCENLVDLKGIPKDVTDTLDLSYTGITYDSLKDLVGLKTAKLDLSYSENIKWPKVKSEPTEDVNKEDGEKEVTTGKEVAVVGNTNLPTTTTDNKVPAKRENP